jgi:predicted enzyme related to lactoylglutathione lyase
MILDHPSRLKVTPFYFGLVTAKFYETWDFYTEQLGFRTLDESDDRVRLIHASGAQLGILRHETDEQHSELVSATDGRGVWLSLEVTDIGELYEKLSHADVPIMQPLDRGPRNSESFVIRDPNGVLIFVTSASAVDLARIDNI